MPQRISYTDKYYTLLYYNTNTDVADYDQIFSGLKLSKEVCVHHTLNEPFLLKSKEFFFCMIAHQIQQLLHMQGCSFYFHVSILGMYHIEQWFYQNDPGTITLKKIPMSTKNISIERTIVFVVITVTVA